MSRPAIVIVAFNRPKSLLRLLGSVAKAEYPEGKLVPLCICIDYQDSKMNREVLRIAEVFDWPYGPKEIICQPVNLGLRQHVLTCGDLTEKYGSIIMLEDDLFVSSDYYNYSNQCLVYYENASSIAGISLYNHTLNISNLFKFEPLQDGNDVYFLQIASSWGQCWTSSQWGSFKKWLGENSGSKLISNVPESILNWPESSWLKLFIIYMVETDKWFVYPRSSYTTNFGDAGVHFGNNNSIFQVPLIYENRFGLRLCLLKESLAVYDSFFEILPEILRRLNPFFIDYEFDCDLYGLKRPVNFKSDMVLTLKNMSHRVASFDLAMRPIEMNVIENTVGEKIFFGEKVNIICKEDVENGSGRDTFNFFFSVVPLPIKIKNIISVIVEGVKKRIIIN